MRPWNKNWLLCLLGIHFWREETMSLEAYAQKFWYCDYCCKMIYKKHEASNGQAKN